MVCLRGSTPNSADGIESMSRPYRPVDPLAQFPTCRILDYDGIPPCFHTYANADKAMTYRPRFNNATENMA